MLVPEASTRAAQFPVRLYGWAILLLAVTATHWLLGPVGLLPLTMVAAVALVATGVRSSGWRRPALIVLGLLLAAAPLVWLFDVAAATVQLRPQP